MNEDLSRDGMSPDDSFESSSLSLSVGDPSPSSDDGGAENLSDVIILSQTHPPNASSVATMANPALAAAPLGSSSTLHQQPSMRAAGSAATISSSALTMANINNLVVRRTRIQIGFAIGSYVFFRSEFAYALRECYRRVSFVRLI